MPSFRSFCSFVRSFVALWISQSRKQAAVAAAAAATVETRLFFIADDTSFLSLSLRAPAGALLTFAGTT